MHAWIYDTGTMVPPDDRRKFSDAAGAAFTDTGEPFFPLGAARDGCYHSCPAHATEKVHCRDEMSDTQERVGLLTPFKLIQIGCQTPG